MPSVLMGYVLTIVILPLNLTVNCTFHTHSSWYNALLCSMFRNDRSLGFSIPNTFQEYIEMSHFFLLFMMFQTLTGNYSSDDSNTIPLYFFYKKWSKSSLVYIIFCQIGFHFFLHVDVKAIALFQAFSTLTTKLFFF